MPDAAHHHDGAQGSRGAGAAPRVRPASSTARSSDRQTWLERAGRAKRRRSGTVVQPYCVIIGGGQGGIALGARLQAPRRADHHRRKERAARRLVAQSLQVARACTTRSGTTTCPTCRSRDHWPVFTPKDKMGDWLEMYDAGHGARLLGFGRSASAPATTRQRRSGRCWSSADGEQLTLRPKQLVFATGSYGPPQRARSARRRTLRRRCSITRAGTSAATPFGGKKCVVIGSNTSAHDICADLWEHGADVTMVQRSPTHRRASRRR